MAGGAMTVPVQTIADCVGACLMVLNAQTHRLDAVVLLLNNSTNRTGSAARATDCGCDWTWRHGRMPGLRSDWRCNGRRAGLGEAGFYCCRHGSRPTAMDRIGPYE